MNEQRSHRRTELLQYYSMRIWRDISNLIKWMILAVITGCVTGAVSSLFARALRLVTRIPRGEPLDLFSPSPVRYPDRLSVPEDRPGGRRDKSGAVYYPLPGRRASALSLP